PSSFNNSSPIPKDTIFQSALWMPSFFLHLFILFVNFHGSENEKSNLQIEQQLFLLLFLHFKQGVGRVETPSVIRTITFCTDLRLHDTLFKSFTAFFNPNIVPDAPFSCRRWSLSSILMIFRLFESIPNSILA